jgi:outer membrane protein
MKKLIYVTLFILGYSANLFADNSYFIDFTKVLNESKAGSQAQENLKKNFASENKKFSQIEKNLKKEESDIISQRKVLSSDDYKKKVEALRKKVSDLQKNKQNSFNKIGKNRNEAKQSLLKSLNPILKKYMEENNIRMIVNKESVILGDSSLEITNQIIEILNRELPSLKIN